MPLQARILVALLTLAVLPVTMHASQASRSASALVKPASTAKWTPDKKNPYSKLFTPARQAARQTAPAPPAAGVAGKPEVKCGMTMIPADPSIDPLIAISRPPDGTRFTIRVIEPSICR